MSPDITRTKGGTFHLPYEFAERLASGQLAALDEFRAAFARLNQEAEDRYAAEAAEAQRFAEEDDDCCDGTCAEPKCRNGMPLLDVDERLR